MNRVSCDTIKDLLPLYVDNVCSNSSKVEIEEHLKECYECKSLLEEMQSTVKCVSIECEQLDEKITLKKIKKNTWLKSIIIFLIITPVFIYMVLVSNYCFGQMPNINSVIYEYNLKKGIEYIIKEDFESAVKYLHKNELQEYQYGNLPKNEDELIERLKSFQAKGYKIESVNNIYSYFYKDGFMFTYATIIIKGDNRYKCNICMMDGDVSGCIYSTIQIYNDELGWIDYECDYDNIPQELKELDFAIRVYYPG